MARQVCVALNHNIHYVARLFDADREWCDVVDYNLWSWNWLNKLLWLCRSISNCVCKNTCHNGSTKRDALLWVEHIVGWLILGVLLYQRAHLRDTCAATNEKDFVNFVDGHARICKSIFDRWDESLKDLLSKLLELLTSDCHI